MPIGAYRHRVAVSNPGGYTPDSDGGFTSGYAPADPPVVDCSIQAATVRDMERVTAGTVLTTATHLIRCRFHKGITTATRLTFKGRTFEVQSVQNVDERDIALVLICAEVVAPGVAGAVSTAMPTPPNIDRW